MNREQQLLIQIATIRANMARQWDRIKRLEDLVSTLTLEINNLKGNLDYAYHLGTCKTSPFEPFGEAKDSKTQQGEGGCPPLNTPYYARCESYPEEFSRNTTPHNYDGLDPEVKE